jgi:hypothetical protein
MHEHHLTIMADLGADADLLLTPDSYLESRRQSLQQRLAMIADELDSVLKAQALKTDMQQQNLVPVRCVEFDAQGQPDVVIRIYPLPDAIAVLEKQRRDPDIPDGLADDNHCQQLQVWENDGYDVRAARRLRGHPA